jgi:AP2-like factor (euAP2 lineage)
MVLDLNVESLTAGSASSSSSSVFRFDLLRWTPDVEGCSPSPPVMTTHQLFPLPSYPDVVAAPTTASNGSPPTPQAAGA